MAQKRMAEHATGDVPGIREMRIKREEVMAGEHRGPFKPEIERINPPDLRFEGRAYAHQRPCLAPPGVRVHNNTITLLFHLCSFTFPILALSYSSCGHGPDGRGLPKGE